MRCGVVIAAVAAVGLALVGPVSTPGASSEWVLLDAPRGAWLASVRSGAPIQVLEERDGWRRIRIEGWVASSQSGSPPSGTDPLAAAAASGAGAGSPSQPAPAGPAPSTGAPDVPAPAVPGPGGIPGAARGATVEGTIAGPGAGSGVAGTRVVLLVGDLPDLDRRHGDLGVECRPSIEAGEERIRALEEEASRALNSSDNFRTAAEAKDRARAAVQKARREQDERIANCRVRAEDLFQRHAIRSGFADSTGRFRFEDVPPGSYRVVAYDAGGDLARTAALECRVEGRDPVHLDAEARRSVFQPFWGLR